jgi:hypothetical protein
LKKQLLPLLFFLIGFLLASNISAFAEDFMAGTVVKTGPARNEIVIVPLDEGKPMEDSHVRSGIIVRLSTDSLVVDKQGRQVLPGCVYPGGIVRVWGHMSDKEKVFYATDIRGWGGRGGHDPTGVRRRLHRGRGWRCPGGPGFHGRD